MDIDPYPLTRASALARLDTFVESAAIAYGARRNLVAANGVHDAVSRLSAALRRRLISEQEAVRAVLAAHPYSAVEKFVAEVFWRTYWKGWLESHSAFWPQFQQEIEDEKERLEGSPAVFAQYQKAIAGATQIEAFDHWVDELKRTGYLHNWARMQVASIWTFTLGLPWQLGADWMFSLLIDADPASNSLSWRWVAGCHTPGKVYLADEAKIKSMTGAALSAKGLALTPTIPPLGPQQRQTDLRQPPLPNPAALSLVLMTCDDLSLETELGFADVRGIVTSPSLAASPADWTAIQDAASRASQHWGVPIFNVLSSKDAMAVANAKGCTQIVLGFATIGSTAKSWTDLAPQFADQGIALTEHQRRWDQLAWPFCSKGFFQLKTRIPGLLRDMGILASG